MLSMYGARRHRHSAASGRHASRCRGAPLLHLVVEQGGAGGAILCSTTTPLGVWGVERSKVVVEIEVEQTQSSSATSMKVLILRRSS